MNLLSFFRAEHCIFRADSIYCNHQSLYFLVTLSLPLKHLLIFLACSSLVIYTLSFTGAAVSSVIRIVPKSFSSPSVGAVTDRRPSAAEISLCCFLSAGSFLVVKPAVSRIHTTTYNSLPLSPAGTAAVCLDQVSHCADLADRHRRNFPSAILTDSHMAVHLFTAIPVLLRCQKPERQVISRRSSIISPQIFSSGRNPLDCSASIPGIFWS